MYYKNILKAYTLTVIICILTFFLLILLRDPYQLFYKHGDSIHSNFRIQDYGIIKFEDFDSIIMGSSMLENTSADEASEKIGGKFVNLSMSGANYYEKFLILQLALKQKEIKQIIYSLDWHFFKVKEINSTFYETLYKDDTISSKFQPYFTDRAIKCVIFNYDCGFKEKNLDRPNAWFNVDYHSRRFGGFENWLKHKKDDPQIQEDLAVLKSSDFNSDVDFTINKEIIDTEILPLFKDNEDTTFNIIIPPYSILWWKKLVNIDEVLDTYAYFLQKTAPYKNVHVYWLYDEEFPLHIENYKDLKHYSHLINSLQIDFIKDKKGIINVSNYQEKFKLWKRKINNFDIQKYIDAIDD